MTDNSLFPKECVIGMFSGFMGCGCSLEFHADLVIPYRSEFQCQPMHGQYLLVQLATPYEAILGRIVSLGSDGDLTLPRNEDANLRALLEARKISEEEREKRLKYRVNMQLLGVLCKDSDCSSFTFVASHRRLPHLGSPVAFPSGEVLREISGHNLSGAAIGHLALGEYIYAQDEQTGHSLIKKENWMHLLPPEILVHFPVENLIARRSFILARAGFGKSNLNKLLFSELYKQTPTVLKRGHPVPVGTILFDPDGEYFWPDDKGRPGLCDVPELQDQLVIFTPREAPSPFYQSFVAGGIKLDLRHLSPVDVLSIALPPYKQGQQNVQKIKGLNAVRWAKLVNLIAAQGNRASIDEISDLLDLDKQKGEALAARANMTTVVQTLHDTQGHLLMQLPEALAQGKLCVIDVSQLHDAQSLILSGFLLHYLFQFNQEEFTKAHSRSIPMIAVIEEAQSVLNGKSAATEPFICWVKEGRKYDLGALLITQQPGSLPPEILSQGDNWFVLHLLSAIDLKTLQKANAYFSQDILCLLLNEPLPGHAVLWSSVGGKPYPISLRVLSFEQRYSRLDPNYDRPAIETFASSLHTNTSIEQESEVTLSQSHVYSDMHLIEAGDLDQEDFDLEDLDEDEIPTIAE
jgi:hypothetical protein